MFSIKYFLQLTAYPKCVSTMAFHALLLTLLFIARPSFSFICHLGVIVPGEYDDTIGNEGDCSESYNPDVCMIQYFRRHLTAQR